MRRNGLQMETGPRFLKPALVGAIVVAFGAVTYTMMSGDDSKPQAPATAAATGMATDQTAANAATDPMATPSEAMPAAPDQMAAASTSTSAGPAGNPADASTNPVASEPAAGTQPMSSPDKLAAADTAPAATAAPAAKPAATTVAKQPSSSNSAAATNDSGSANTAAADSAALSEPMAKSSEVADAAPTEKRKAAKPKMLRPNQPGAEALRAWWQTPESPQRLGVEYVGQAADQKSLVIRFDQQVTDPVAAQNIKLVSSTGQQIDTNWQAGEDPRVLVAPNLEPGRYTVLIGPQLASIQGQSLGTELHGPAFIQ